jgi:hypothetical protein
MGSLQICGIAGMFSYHGNSPPVRRSDLMRVGECMVAAQADMRPKLDGAERLLWRSLPDRYTYHIDLSRCKITHDCPDRRGILPESVFNRRKSGFAVPTYQWLNRDAPITMNNRDWAKALAQK